MSSQDATFKAFADVNRPRIEKHLKAVLRLQQLQAKGMGDSYYHMVKQLNTLITRGGKRMRPLLFLLSYRGYGGRRTSSALELAVSQELLHAFLLIHDDIIDRDFIRWGGPNITSIYFDAYGQSMSPRDALHMAESISILAGDACLNMAYERVTASGMDNHVVLGFLQHMHQVVQEVISGELNDVTLGRGRKLPTEAEVLSMYRAKTASYSFRLPLQLGALAAGAPESELQRLAAIAEALGVAFQVYDDIQGVFADEKTIGKPAMSDLREGKRTLLVIRTLQQATPSERKALLALLDSGNTDPEYLELGRDIIVAAGAREYCEELITKHVNTAVELIGATGLASTQKAMLVDVANHLCPKQ
jgi:geranylgeranyl diphosphate synthase, type II